MPRNRIDFTFDYNLRLKDAGLVAADAAAQVGGVDKILDLGASRVDGRVIVDTTAVEVASGDERYLVKAQFSNSSTFASGIVGGPALDIGDSSVTKDSADHGAVGRYELAFTNEISGTTYRYMRMFTEVQGTIATGINYIANAVLAA
jgi:hypothetical protein